MAESEFDQSITPAIVPIMPGISPYAQQNMLKETYRWGTPWKQYFPWDPNSEKRVQRYAADVGNRKALNEIVWDYTKELDNPEKMAKRGHSKKYIETLKLAKEELGDEMMPNGMTRAENDWVTKKEVDRLMKDVTKKVKLKRIDDFRDPKAIGEVTEKYPKGRPTRMGEYKLGNTPNSKIYQNVVIPELKNTLSQKPSWWSKAGDLTKGFFKTPLGKLTSATGRLAGAASIPLMLASELDYSEGNWKHIFMPKYEYNLDNDKVERIRR